MVKMPPSAQPPRRQQGYDQNAQGQFKGDSPALQMAGRIRSEQGPERAAQYLAAMEPFLAPGERSHIAYMLGLPQPAPVPQPLVQSPPQQHAVPPAQGQGGLGALGNIGNIMQMMQLMNGLQGLKGGGQPGQSQGQQQGPNPAQLAQLLGGVMGGQK